MADLQLVIETATLAPPVIFGHGGAGKVPDPERLTERSTFILSHAREAMALLVAGANTRGLEGGVCKAVLRLTEDMELNPAFNAGRGSKLQRDGKIRVSAALMDGSRTRMAAIYNAEHCLHPATLAGHLLETGDRNVDGLGAANLMREHGIAPESLEMPERRAEFEKRKAGQTGTIGVVAV
ncbi:MAG: isoaspartyl peptidase/L-asparaginase, partial [Planctomycetota bacterium]